jgi:methionyl-tRNA formyltransferase
MTILFLGPEREHLMTFLQSFGDTVFHCDVDINSRPDLVEDADLIVSYGYRHILRSDFVTEYYGKIINLHISLLPWNRGADPNVWSFLEDTPKGVSIHLVDKGIDTGPVLAQEEIEFGSGETLASTYNTLTQRIESLFIKVWPDIRSGQLKLQKQRNKGTFHRKRDIEQYQHLLTNGWETPVDNLIGLAIKTKSMEYASK